MTFLFYFFFAHLCDLKQINNDVQRNNNYSFYTFQITRVTKHKTDCISYYEYRILFFIANCSTSTTFMCVCLVVIHNACKYFFDTQMRFIKKLRLLKKYNFSSLWSTLSLGRILQMDGIKKLRKIFLYFNNKLYIFYIY